MDDLPPVTLRTRVATVKNIVLGGAPIGSLFSHVPAEQGRTTVQRALDLGITQFDTAPLYGLGESELLMGDVLSKHRGDFALWTKVGRTLKRKDEVQPDDEVDSGYAIYKIQTNLVPVFDFSAAAVKEEFAACLARCRTKITGLRVHDADTDKRFAAAMATEGAVAELVRMRERREIEYVSVGLNDPAMLCRFARAAPPGVFDTFMCAGSWNLLDFSAYELLALCEHRGIRITNAGIFGSGILWGGATLRYAAAPPDAIAKVRLWEDLAREYSIPLPAVALAFALLPAAVENVAIGCRSPEEVDANVALLKYTVPPQLWADAQNRGLLPNWLPLPQRV